MNKQILHFTIGPVQSFVGQARRTRDLWAGSFLLSWLSGQAIAKVLELDGKIAFPVVVKNKETKDPLLDAIQKSKEDNNDHDHPKVGSLPNRFKAIFDESKNIQNQDICKIEEKVQQKWQELADAVYKEFVEPYAQHGKDTKIIWDDQVANFWEINWVLGDDNEENETIKNGKTVKLDGSWLDIRKNWRNHWPIPQGGDHCTLMGDWQEISGFIRSDFTQRKKQDEFWTALHSEKVNLLELREGERLCAIALIKRLFPRLPKQALIDTIGWIPGGSPEAVGGWPSTAYLATLPWFDWVNKDQERTNALSDYQSIVESTLNPENGTNNYARLASEQATNIQGLENLGKATEMDGNLFQIAALENYRMTPLSKNALGKIDEEPKSEDAKNRGKLIEALNNLTKTQLNNSQPQPFYALLVMDGDNMGKLLQDSDIDDNSISEALLQFTLTANDIVEEHQGKLLYAGGDDVLALISMTKAVDCAIALRNSYSACFEEQTKLEKFIHLMTASTAIIYSHFHTPLKDVLEQGHSALDDVAKEKNGRNSLSLTVFKPEGITAQWVGCFSKAVKKYQKFQKAVKKGKYSTSFLYNLKNRYPSLFDKDYVQEGAENHAYELLLAEYLKGKSFKKGKEKKEKKKAQKAVQKILNAMGKQKGNETEINTKTTLQIDAAYIARFIVDNGYNFGRKRGDSNE